MWPGEGRAGRGGVNEGGGREDALERRGAGGRDWAPGGGREAEAEMRGKGGGVGGRG
ncbi:hypothetical protein [Oryza sativa Japonica Group]|uniref:Uncharacterized protein n=1 Tax=Oryza sativa subsp. japonica TaxID=39947 RepID=Q656I0_ORYSJ|nr:hypothetical protein [Oryza sativa Japonica Group]